MGKQPKTKFAPQDGKSPRIGADPSNHHSKLPAWRVRKLEMAGPFGWHDVDRETLASVRTKLADFETMVGARC